MNLSVFLMCDERILLNRVWSLEKKNPSIFNMRAQRTKEEKPTIYWSIHLHNLTQGSVIIIIIITIIIIIIVTIITIINNVVIIIVIITSIIVNYYC